MMMMMMFSSLAVFDQRIGHTMDVVSPYLSLSSVILADSSTGSPVHALR